MRHGSCSGYQTYGCRCSPCRAWKSAYQAKQRERFAKTPFELIPHGKTGYDLYSCRCETRSEAKRDYRAALASRKREEKARESSAPVRARKPGIGEGNAKPAQRNA